MARLRFLLGVRSTISLQGPADLNDFLESAARTATGKKRARPVLDKLALARFAFPFVFSPVAVGHRLRSIVKLEREMPDQVQQYFGLLIAFLLPGMVGVYAMSFYAPFVAEWFGIAAKSETTIGGFLFVFLASIGMGVFISGCRWLLLEHLIQVFPPPPAKLDAAQRNNPDKEAAYQDARVQHYMFYLFHSNLLIALPLVTFAWFSAGEPRSFRDAGVRVIGLCIATFINFKCGKDALAKFDRKAAQILSFDNNRAA